MSGWKTAALGDVCLLIARGVAPKYVDKAGTLVLNQKCVRDHAVNYGLGRRHDETAKRVSPDRFIQVGDLLINSTGTGTLGRVAQVRRSPDEPATVDTHVTIVRPTPGEFDPDFFGYALIVLEDQLAASGEGASGQTELARSTVAKFEISYPTDLAEQRRIVAVLDKSFAAIATAAANAEKNLASARELFVSGLESIIGGCDADWTERPIGEVCKFVGGSQPPKAVFAGEPADDSIRLIQIRDYKSDRHKVFIPKQLAKRLCSSDDVMIGRYGPPLFQILRGINGAYNVALMKAVPNTDLVSKDFLYFFIRNQHMLQYIIAASARAAGQIGLTKETLEPYPIRYPSLEAQAKIVSQLTELETQANDLIRIQRKKLETLAALKQSLLHRAFTGELTATMPETIAA